MNKMSPIFSGLIFGAFLAYFLGFVIVPSTFGLEGAALIAAQVAGGIAGLAGGVILTRFLRGKFAEGERATQAIHEEGWGYRTDVHDMYWGGSIEDQIRTTNLGNLKVNAYIDARQEAIPFDVGLIMVTEGHPTPGNRSPQKYYGTTSVRTPLGRDLPRMTLRSRSGAGVLGNLPYRSGNHQVLRLEGNFSDVFEFAVPNGYERDALYLLTPDVMAALIDIAGDLDLETVDGVLYIYFPDMHFDDDAQRGRIRAVVEAVHRTLGKNAVAYTDERVAEYAAVQTAPFSAAAVNPAAAAAPSGAPSPLVANHIVDQSGRKLDNGLWWRDILPGLGCLAFAVVPMTPLWAEIARPDARGRNGGMSRLLASIGPMPVTITLAVIGLGIITWVIVSQTRRRR